MSKRKKSNPTPAVPPQEEDSSSPSWFESTNSRKLTVPLGPSFQVEIPNCISREAYIQSTNESKWLGTQTWPNKKTMNQPESKAVLVGKGRPDTCRCSVPGSIECVKHHILEKRRKLKSELGPAFTDWKFDVMGEESFLKTWKLADQMKFVELVKNNPASEGMCFLEQAIDVFPTKKRKELIDYYFNVYIPRRFSKQTRSGCTAIDTDDEEAAEKEPSKAPTLKSPETSSSSSQDVKATYLVGRR